MQRVVPKADEDDLSLPRVGVTAWLFNNSWPAGEPGSLELTREMKP